MNADLLLRWKENDIGPICTPLLHPVSSFDLGLFVNETTIGGV
jgi:hypothetical protein